MLSAVATGLRGALSLTVFARLCEGNGFQFAIQAPYAPGNTSLKLWADICCWVQRLAGIGTAEPARYAEPWNFGPAVESCLPVGQVVDSVIEAWGTGAWTDCHNPNDPHEAGVLRLSIDKAIARLGWLPRWGLQETIVRSVAWYRAHHEKAASSTLVDLCIRNINDYMTGS